MKNTSEVKIFFLSLKLDIVLRNSTPETFLPIDKVGEFWNNNCDDDWKNANSLFNRRPTRPSPPATLAVLGF